MEKKSRYSEKARAAWFLQYFGAAVGKCLAAAPVVSLQWEILPLQHRDFSQMLFEVCSALISSHFLSVFDVHKIKQKQHKNTMELPKFNKIIVEDE